MNYERIRIDNPRDGVARITLARPDKRNAQDRRMLDELDTAFTAAADDDTVRVIVLAADGPDFSSGHDLTDFAVLAELTPEQHFELEEKIFLGYSRRWRNLPKPTIAQVHGRTIAGGLMLIWPCDLIVASEDATFSDPVTAFGVNGHEYFTHVWELGARKAKEMLFRGTPLTASECERLGMVNHVVAATDLEDFTLQIAGDIAARPAVGIRLAKQAVNDSLDAQGQWTAIRSAFALHHLGHATARVTHGRPVV